jgi:DNA-binding Lrp family transcriptional regulator
MGAMSCPSGKIEHLSRKSAEAHADSILKKDGHLPNIYICPDCNTLHVGGGRKSDQPIVRAQQTKTPWRDRVVKPSAAKTLTAEDLILNELINTFKPDVEIARNFSTTELAVVNIRKTLGIPTYGNRKQEAIVKLLQGNPGLNYREIAKRLNFSESAVIWAVKKAGLLEETKIGRPRGVKNKLYGRKYSIAHRSAISQKLKEFCKNNPNRPSHTFTDEDRAEGRKVRMLPYVRAAASKAAKQMWADPDKHAQRVAKAIEVNNRPEMIEAHRKRFTQFLKEHPEINQVAAERFKKRWKDPVFRARMTVKLKKPRKAKLIEKELLTKTILTGLSLAKMCVMLNCTVTTIDYNMERYWGTDRLNKIRGMLGVIKNPSVCKVCGVPIKHESTWCKKHMHLSPNWGHKKENATCVTSSKAGT